MPLAERIPIIANVARTATTTNTSRSVNPNDDFPLRFSGNDLVSAREYEFGNTGRKMHTMILYAIKLRLNLQLFCVKRISLRLLQSTINMKRKLLPNLLVCSALLGISEAATSLPVTGGHIDGPAFGYDTVSGFEPHIHNEGGSDGAIINGVREELESEYEPDELIFVVPETSTITVSGQVYFWLPEDGQAAFNQGAPFVGIGLEELSPGDWVNGTVTLSLLSMTGPGEFLLWQDDGLGGITTFLDTLNNVNSFTLPAGTHTHYNWGFTEAGLIGLEFGISGTHVSDGFQSASATYSYLVPEPGTSMLGLFGLGLCLLRRKR
jgi:surface-anchored protein